MAAASGKKSQTGSITSRLSHNNHHQPAGGGSGGTSGGGSERSGVPASSASPPHPALGLSNVYDVIDVLYGGLSRGNPRVTSSGGASTYSGGGGGGGALPGLGNGLTSLQLTSSPSTAAAASASMAPPPVSNVAMALVMLNQRIQTLIDAQSEASHKVVSEVKDDLASLRVDVTDSRNLINSMMVEIEAIRVGV